MSPIDLILQFLIFTVIAGLLGAAAMDGIMHLITRSGFTEARMVTALGSLFTKSLGTARVVGWFIHGVSGVLFAMIYTLLFMAFGLELALACLAAGLGVGFLHGIVVSIMLVMVVSEHHPIEEFRNAGIQVGVAHLAGHLAYGAVVGLVIGISGFVARSAGL